MNKRVSSGVCFPEIFDIKMEEEEEDPLQMINEEQFDNPKTRPMLLANSGARTSKRIKIGRPTKAVVAVPIKIVSCARLDLEIYENSDIVYKLCCTHCETSVLLRDWKVFLKHLENDHSKITSLNTKECADNNSGDSNVEDATWQPEQAPIVPPLEVSTNEKNNVENTTIKTETNYSDKDEFSAEDADNGTDDESNGQETMELDDMESNKTAKKKKFKSEDDGEDDYDEEKTTCKKGDKIITFTRTDKEIVLGFLEMLKMHPLLWHRRQSIIQRYDKALVEMAAKFHAKFPKHKLSINDMRLSIYRIKKLYDKAVNPPKKQTDAEATFKTKYPKYFEMCTEIEEESKKMSKKCDSCGMSFIDELDLQVHAFQMHRVGELPFKCQHCNRRFANEAKLAYHEKKDHVERKFPCLICDKSFDKESRLHSHMSLHVGVKQICEICGKSFDSSYRYRRHMLHHAPPQFKCELCGKMLYEKYTLSEHMKTHYNQRNYACEICGKTFNINNGLQIHRRQVHKVKTQIVWSKKAPTNEHSSGKPSPASNLNVNTQLSIEMKPSIEQHSLLEAPPNPSLTHAVFQDRLINDLLNLQQQQQPQENLHQGHQS